MITYGLAWASRLAAHNAARLVAARRLVASSERAAKIAAYLSGPWPDTLIVDHLQ